MKLLGFFIFPILAVLLSTAPSAGAASLTPVEGLELLRRAFAGIDDFSAGITQEKQLALMKKKMTARGEVRFKKPNMFYMELYPPYSSRVLLKDTTLTLKLSNDGERQQVTLPSEQGLGRWFRFLNQPVTSIPAGFDIRADKRGNSVILRISPRNNGALRELELTFQETGRLQKLVIEENNRDSTVITFNRMKRNTGLTDQDFRLE